MGAGLLFVAMLEEEAVARRKREYQNDFLKLGFELKQEWVSAKTIKYFVPAKYFIKKYFVNAQEKRWLEAQKVGAGRIIEEVKNGSNSRTNELLRTTDYMLCKEEEKEGYYRDEIYYILTGSKINYAYYNMPIEELKKIKEEEDKKFKESQK